MKKLLFIIALLCSKGLFAQTATATLTAAGTDADGVIVSYKWTQVSGESCTIASPAIAQTNITFTTPGDFVFQCLVTDNGGATATATATITVYAANVPPKVVITPSTITIQLK